MTYRISQGMMYRRFLTNLYNVNERLETATERISSGRQLNRSSDDPTFYTLALGLKKNMEENDQYLRNIQNAEKNLSVAEGFVSKIHEVLLRADVLGVQGGSETYSASNRQAIALEISEIREEIISYLNHQSEGKYIFSGTDTTTEPFDLAGNYLGNTDPINLDVSVSTQVQLNITGDDLAFGSGGQGSADDMLDTLQDLVNGLNSDDTAVINTAVVDLDNIMDRVSNLISDIGQRRGRLESFMNHYENLNLILAKSLEDIESTDYAEEISSFTQDTTIRDAAMKSATNLQLRNLFDYIG